MENKKTNMSLTEHMRRNDLVVGRDYRLHISIFFICIAVFLISYGAFFQILQLNQIIYYVLLILVACYDFIFTRQSIKNIEKSAGFYEKWSRVYSCVLLLWSIGGIYLNPLKQLPELPFEIIVVITVVGIRMIPSVGIIIYTVAFMINYVVQQICNKQVFDPQDLFIYICFYIVVMLILRQINHAQQIMVREAIKEAGKVKKLERQTAFLSNKNKELSDNIKTDIMTGLGNRQASEELVKEYFEKKEPFTIAYVGLDYLKECNVNFGHMEGNNYILRLCEFLEDVIEDEEKLFRIEGGRFLIISGVASEKGLTQRLEEARQEFVQLQNEKNDYLHDFSYGVVEIGDTEQLSYFAAFSMAEQRVNYMDKKEA